MSTAVPEPIIASLPSDVRVAVVAARFNAHITDELLTGCVLRLQELGLSKERIEIYRVPGAFELPVTAKALATTHRVAARSFVAIRLISTTSPARRPAGASRSR